MEYSFSLPSVPPACTPSFVASVLSIYRGKKRIPDEQILLVDEEQAALVLGEVSGMELCLPC